MEQKNENVDILKKEIELVLDRNKDENYFKPCLHGPSSLKRYIRSD